MNSFFQVLLKYFSGKDVPAPIHTEKLTWTPICSELVSGRRKRTRLTRAQDRRDVTKRQPGADRVGCWRLV